MEERILVKRAQHGDCEAFGQLYATCYQRLYKYALYTLRNTEDAEDAVSETVTDAFASIKNLKKDQAFQAWIYAILVNKCKRKRKEYLSKAFELTEEMQEADDYERAQDSFMTGPSQEEAMDIKLTMLDLPELERTIISMNVFLGYTTREIAEALDMNENTVRSKKSRALEKLRGKLS